uniref:Uncharacterized protein n=1 Tax=Romanomermis culicivorax TaxID=13658 RepID=A0A915I6T4_ROMCU
MIKNNNFVFAGEASRRDICQSLKNDSIEKRMKVQRNESKKTNNDRKKTVPKCKVDNGKQKWNGKHTEIMCVGLSMLPFTG